MRSNRTAVLRYLTVEALVCLSSHLQSWAMTCACRRNRVSFQHCKYLAFIIPANRSWCTSSFQDGSPFLHKPKTWNSPSLFSSVVSFSVDFVGQTPCPYILGVLPAQPPIATKTHCSNIVVMWKMFWASLCYLQHGSPAKRTLAFDRAGRLPCLGQDFKTQWFCHGWKSHPFVSWIVRSQKKETECPASTTRQHQKSKSNVGPHTLQTTYKLQLKASCIPDIDSTTREFAPTLKPTIPFAIIKETMFSFTSHR